MDADLRAAVVRERRVLRVAALLAAFFGLAPALGFAASAAAVAVGAR